MVPKAPVNACENYAAILVDACAVGDATHEGWVDGTGVAWCDMLALESVL